MAKKAESLNLSSTLDTTLDQEEKGNDEMSDDDELRYFIGQEEFKDSVQKWKEVRYRYYFFIFLPPHFSQILPEI